MIDKIKSLQEELEEAESKAEKKLKLAQENHKIEMRRNKDAWLAS